MSSLSHNRDAVELLAEEFLNRFRRGERPDVSDYAQRHPELADQIDRLFPALVVLEQIGASANPGVERLVPAGLTRIGEYRILREVGRGGMGVVFEAIQESLGRHVALKVLPPALCRDKYLERFQREAKAAARLHHTNIVPVFGVGMDAGMHFYVMQFIDGRGLDSVLHEVRRLRDGAAGHPLDSTEADLELSSLARGLLSGSFARPAAEGETGSSSAQVTADSNQAVPPAPSASYFRAVARLGKQAAEALHYAHTQGVLHRDVKPSNLLLAAGGTAWVADFGLAKADDSEDLTDTGDLVGTLRYMAPERLQGRCDARSDIHGLGITLFELITLRPAFDAQGRLRLLDQVARGAAPRLRQLVPGLPRDLEMIIGKAMAPEPQDRYATAQDLADDLDCFLTDRPIRARQVSIFERLGRWGRRHPAVAALIGTIVFLLALGAAGGWWAAARLGFEVQAVKKAEANVTERLWESRLAQAQAGRASRLPGQRFASLAAIAEAARIRPTRDLRNEAIACMALTDVEVDKEWDANLQTNRLAFSTGVAFDPTLEHYAYTTADGRIVVQANPDDKPLVILSGPPEPADFLKFSPDGRYLAARWVSGATHPCKVWDWRRGRLILERSHNPSFVLGIDFMADGNSLVLESDRQLETIALPSGQVLSRAALSFFAGWLAVEPEQGKLAAVAGHMAGLLQVVDLADGTVLAVWNDIPTELVAVAWRPQGDLLAASGRDGNLYTFDLGPRFRRTRPAPGSDPPLIQQIRTPTTVLRGHSLEARELTFSPDGALLVSRGWDSTTRFWDPVRGQELLRIQGLSFLQFDKESNRLAFRGYNSRRLGIWNMADKSLCRVMHGTRSRSPQGQAGVSFSPDSLILATCASENVSLWDSRSGRLLRRLNTGATSDILFDPAGRYFYSAGVGGTAARPLTRSAVGADVLWTIGSPEPAIKSFERLNGYQLHADQSGDRLAVVERFARVVVSRPGSSEPCVVFQNHPEVSSASLSPDGRLVATGTWRGQNVNVWDAETAQQLCCLATTGSAGAGFSPDGSRLFVLQSGGNLGCYRTDTWEKVWEKENPAASFTRGLRGAFHPGGYLMAHVIDQVNLRLVDLKTGDELATLAAPESQNLSGYQFSPDGRFLAAVTVQGAVQIWDLWRLRAELRKMDLDWNTPDSGSAGDPGGEVRVDLRK